jgi:tetratricopeptide (TPR) repeat protein
VCVEDKESPIYIVAGGIMAISQEEYFDLGSYHRPVTTASSLSQTWFDRGLIWAYAFNHEEAAACFEHSIKHDSRCAMAYWGLAYSIGPNYNQPWESYNKEDRENIINRVRQATLQAKKLITTGAFTPVEAALISALQLRYPESQQPSQENLAIWNRDYADAMESVYQAFPSDLDVVTLYADALMNLTPWKLWDLTTGKPTDGARTLAVKEALDKTLSQEEGALSHPGLLHMYIHLMEMSNTPEKAITIAQRLAPLVPDAGHLIHMPSHLHVICGDYRSTIMLNTAAIRADEKYDARVGPLNFYTLYRAHNYHFCIYGAMFAGQFRVALNTITMLENSIPEELLRVQSPPMADWLEGFFGARVHVLVRFGRWQDLLELSTPRDTQLYCVTTAMMHYGRAIAQAVTGHIAEAETEQSAFANALELVPASRTLFNNKCVDILAVAKAMLEGEIEYRRGNYDQAFKALRQAIALDDTLPYDEPWGWMQPTRHAYGALLLEQGRIEEAAAVYRADLGLQETLPRPMRHPNNVWSLHGYHECLTRLGRTAEATILQPQLKLALEIADVPIQSSCFCRNPCC